MTEEHKWETPAPWSFDPVAFLERERAAAGAALAGARTQVLTYARAVGLYEAAAGQLLGAARAAEEAATNGETVSTGALDAAAGAAADQVERARALVAACVPEAAPAGA